MELLTLLCAALTVSGGITSSDLIAAVSWLSATQSKVVLLEYRVQGHAEEESERTR